MCYLKLPYNPARWRLGLRGNYRCTITARFCTVPPIALDSSASQAEKRRLKDNIKCKANITVKFIE